MPALRSLSFINTVPVSEPVSVGMKLKLRSQVPPGAKAKLEPQSAGVPGPVSRAKSGFCSVQIGEVAISGLLPPFPMVKVRGLSLLVVPTIVVANVVAKLWLGSPARLSSLITWWLAKWEKYTLPGSIQCDSLRLVKAAGYRPLRATSGRHLEYLLIAKVGDEKVTRRIHRDAIGELQIGHYRCLRPAARCHSLHLMVAEIRNEHISGAVQGDGVGEVPSPANAEFRKRCWCSRRGSSTTRLLPESATYTLPRAVNRDAIGQVETAIQRTLATAGRAALRHFDHRIRARVCDVKSSRPIDGHSLRTGKSGTHRLQRAVVE